jgi:CDP-diacylglycerol--glycerol-3-phosphate 3-phosphatidyltransferase
MLDGNFRKSVDSVTAPVGRWLVRVGFSADVLTGSGLIFACATAWAIGAGYFYLAIVLLTLTGFHDLFDGPVAKASHRASQRGSFFDSVVDRLSDGILMGGVAFYLTARQHGELVLLPFAILTTTFMISYQRSKGGLMERAERMVLLGAAMLWAPAFIPGLWVILVLTAMTAGGRFWRVWQIAARPEPVNATSIRHLQANRLRRGLSRTSRH